MALDLYTIPVTRIDGTVASLADFRGDVLLIVNVASKCGLTPQYEGLERLHKTYAAKGLDVLGFPANDFGGQEPGTDADIQTFCTTNFGASFPMFSKIQVTGENRHPLYSKLIEAKPTSTGEDKSGFIEGLIQFGIHPNPEPELLWNFEKFLVGRNGEILARFSPNTLPDDPALTTAIETALSEK